MHNKNIGSKDWYDEMDRRFDLLRWLTEQTKDLSIEDMDKVQEAVESFLNSREEKTNENLL